MAILNKANVLGNKNSLTLRIVVVISLDLVIKLRII